MGRLRHILYLKNQRRIHATKLGAAYAMLTAMLRDRHTALRLPQHCHDNVVADNLFNLIKRERIRRRSYKTHEQARQDVFVYIEIFYNPKRKHVLREVD